jgi:hypothetical protein
MRIRPFLLPAVATTLVLLGPLFGYEAATHAASAAPKSPSPYRHVYRLDYGLTVTEAGKAPTTSAYVLNVEEGQSGDVRAGANIPLQTATGSMMAPRMDVGVALHCQLARAGNELILHTSAELSAPEDRADPGPRAIRKVTASDDAVVTPGKPTLVASIEEQVSHARYEVMVTATKLR